MDYHGTFTFIFRDAHLNARNSFALSRPPEQRRIYECYLSGPVRGSKKTSFLVSVNRNEEDNQSIVFAQGLSGSIQQNVPAPVRNLLVATEISHALSDGVALSLNSGLPYTLTTGLDEFHTGTANARPAGVSRNSLQGPGSANLDLRWSRDFSLLKGKKKDEGVKATLAVDAFNVLNKVNYVGYVGNLSSPFFGQAIAAQPPRRLQMSFRVKF